MSAHPNNTPEQKAAWEAAKHRRGSRYARRIPSEFYNPTPKEPSRRDRHRMEVAARKLSGPIGS